jgi:membrane-bound inhibitor of C-type lysozyme
MLPQAYAVRAASPDRQAREERAAGATAGAQRHAKREQSYTCSQRELTMTQELEADRRS